MSEIKFIKTEFSYDSYTDFWRLVALSDYPIVSFKNIDYESDNIYIVAPINGEVTYYEKKRKCKILAWNLERPGEQGLGFFCSSNVEHIKAGELDGIIVSDITLANQTGFKYVPLGSHPHLGYPGLFQDKVYDFIHLSCYSNRRSFLFSEPGVCLETVAGMRVAGNCWDPIRHQRLSQSKFMLNIHQWSNDEYSEPLRFALAAAYGLPVVSEILHFQEKFPYGFWVLQATAGFPLATLKERLEEYETEKWYDYGLAFRKDVMENYTFRKMLEKYL